MANPRIQFNSKSIDFPRCFAALDILPTRDALRNLSASRIPETLNICAGFSVRALIQHLYNADATQFDLKTALFELKEWAEAGEEWTLMLDSAKTVNTTLDGVLAAGGTSVPVVSATGVVSGRRYAIESETQVAIVKATNSATDPIGIAVGVNYAFPVGARFRDYEYLPMFGSLQITEHDAGLFYDVEIIGSVDKRNL